MFQKELYNLRLKCKRFRNTRHTITFGIPVSQDACSVDFRGLPTKLSLSCPTVASETSGLPVLGFWYSFLVEGERTSSPNATGRTGKLKKIINFIGFRTRDLSACSIVP
jgi:hypothetical protein